jgi:predicted LPLAT superfamily acyltransferase
LENKKWDGKTRGGKLGHELFIFFLKYFGIRFAYFILRFVAFWFALFSRKSAKGQYRFFRKRMKYGKLKSVVSVYRNHFIFGQILLDKVAILSGLGKKFTYEHTNPEVIRKMLCEKTGGILINAHIGSWETAGQLLEMHGDKIYIVMLDAEHEKIKKVVKSTVGEERVDIIAVKTDGSHLRKIDEVLRNKGIIAIHGDRVLGDAATVEHEFLGEKARFAAGPFALAAKYGVPYSFATAFKTKRFHYHFYASEPIYVKYPGNLTERKNEIFNQSKLYVQLLEEMIRKYPLQWFNYYEFW